MPVDIGASEQPPAAEAANRISYWTDVSETTELTGRETKTGIVVTL